MTDLTPTAQRMMDTLPAYYLENDWVRRTLNGWAAEIDRQDAMLDNLKNGLVPILADDSVGMLAIWERTFRLPVMPAGRTLEQRQQSVQIAMQALDAQTAADVMALLDAQGVGYTITRDDPGALQDTLTINAAEGTFQAILIQQIAEEAWPSHRELVIAFSSGFTLDLSELDLTEM